MKHVRRGTQRGESSETRLRHRVLRRPGNPLCFVEVKGRIAGADTDTITRNEILTDLNWPEQFILAVVEVENGEVKSVQYLREPFKSEPDFSSVKFPLSTLLQGAESI